MNEIAKINDQLRISLPFLSSPHRFVMTSAVASLSAEKLINLFHKVRSFEDFNRGNDPYKEHDCGVIDFEGDQYVWKIDYYDQDFQFFKENGNRVLTLMHTSEY